MGGATKFMALLITPIPPLRPSFALIHRRISSIALAPRRILTIYTPSKTKTHSSQLVNSLHSKSVNTAYAIQSSGSQNQQNHPWPEWTYFLNILSSGQGFCAPDDHAIPCEDAFVVYEELSNDFAVTATACLVFARARPNLLGLLSKTDIEAVVSNGTPFLFKTALDTSRRMRAFLESKVSEHGKANTIDLMKYILSYTSNPSVSERKGLYSRELVESSVRNLLHEIGTLCGGVTTGYMPVSRQTLGQNIDMKRGDWICQKCNFMNFAKNMKCLECEELRPKKQLIGGEWECPQCNFYNYGRNLVCLRCECRRPGSPLFNNNISQFNLGYKGNFSNTNKKLVENEQKVQPRWLSKTSQLNNSNGSNNAVMPLRKADNKTNNTNFVPFPPGHFGKKDDTEKSNGQDSPVKDDTKPINSGDPNQPLRSTLDLSVVRSFSQSENNGDVLDMSEEAKAERWFKRVAQIKDISELSQIPDEDFPSIMPMRKGVNRFVVSKRKTPLERRLTSQQYRRNLPIVVSSDNVKESDSS